MTTKTPESGMSEMYDRRMRGTGFLPATYSDERFVQMTYNAAYLSQMPFGERVLDIMSGPGKLIAGLRAIDPRHQYTALDLLAGAVSQIQGNIDRIRGNGFILPLKDNSVRVALLRYSAKDYPYDQQQELLAEAARVITPGGRLVLVDMFAPVVGDLIKDGQLYEFVNYQHAMKQERGGRNRETEGACNILPERGWIKLLTNTGFKNVRVFAHYVSRVSTEDWKGQVRDPDKHIPEMNHILLTAPEIAKKIYRIREEDGKVKIEFPVDVITARKPRT